MAGHTTTGASVASSVAVSRSLEMPAAQAPDHPGGRRGDHHHVGGLAEAVWGMGSASSNSERWTGSDARAENVVSPTKRVAPRVMTGTTWAPGRRAGGAPRSPCRRRCRPTPPARHAAPRARRGPTRSRAPRRARRPHRPRRPRRGQVMTILSLAISSNAIDSGLRATDVTCGGTMAPRPSPSWLKYALICRARLALSVTRENLVARSRSPRSTGSSSCLGVMP